MKTVYLVITDCGDGSNNIEWHKTWSDDKYEKAATIEQYQSGDGVQVRELTFPPEFDLDKFAMVNYIRWADEDFNKQ